MYFVIGSGFSPLIALARRWSNCRFAAHWGVWWGELRWAGGVDNYCCSGGGHGLNIRGSALYFVVQRVAAGAS